VQCVCIGVALCVPFPTSVSSPLTCTYTYIYIYIYVLHHVCPCHIGVQRGYLLDNCIASWHGDLSFRDAFRRRLAVLRMNSKLGSVWSELGSSLRTGPESHPMAAWACFQVAQSLSDDQKRQDAQKTAQKEVRSQHPEFFAIN
jgi:hypothetical protein